MWIETKNSGYFIETELLPHFTNVLIDKNLNKISEEGKKL
jgi:hypothetical protein